MLTMTGSELRMPGWQTSCFTSLLVFAFALYNRLRPDPCSVYIDTPQDQPEYDFIVIGAGSAGNVVANRLTECHNWTLLLLEAGDPPPDSSEVPFINADFLKTKYDWQYKTAPLKHGQAYCLAIRDHRCPVPRGKVVGGSSILNGMQYIRGNKNNYDDWKAMGNEGWGYQDVLKYFLKSEDNTNRCYLQTPFHSSGGYLGVENVRYLSPLAYAFVRAGEFLGYKIRDVNGRHQEGFMISQATTRKGARSSTARAFLQPVQRRPNLHLSVHSFVTRIGFETGHSASRARTVSYHKGNKEYTVKAKKEIIVSAGVINSPQLLMLSGIGPEKHLTDLGINVVKNLPVGHNLQDHPQVVEFPLKVSKNVTLKPDVVRTPDNVLEYFERCNGPLTSTADEGQAFIYSKYAQPSRPDIQLEFQPESQFNNGLNALISDNDLWPDLFNGTKYEHLDTDGNYFNIQLIMVRPKSRGQLSLRTRNPYDYPIINPNYFGRREDLDAMISGYQILLKLLDTPPFREYGATPLKIPFPGCEGLRLFSDEYFECFIRQFTQTAYHMSSTCSMGIGPDAVVDPRLRVIGVTGLRVIDASIMPFVVSGNLNAPTILIGEKGADMIKEDWNYLSHCPEQSKKCKDERECPEYVAENSYFECNED